MSRFIPQNTISKFGENLTIVLKVWFGNNSDFSETTLILQKKKKKISRMKGKNFIIGQLEKLVVGRTALQSRRSKGSSCEQNTKM